MLIEKTTEAHRNSHVIYAKYKAGDELNILVCADVHFDNPKCKRDLLKKHLDEAKEKDAMILIPGDFFCVMQGVGDWRGSKKDVLPQHMTGNYLDSVVNEGIDFLAPYADNIAVIGYGNHETSVKKRKETDLIKRLVQGINDRAKPKHPVYVGGYGGRLNLQFEHQAGGNCFRQSIYYYHGSGGGGPVTLGSIQQQRMSAYVEDADIIVTGHVHENIETERVKICMDRNFKPVQRVVKHLIAPTYKEEYGDGHGGWHVERGAPPKPIGGKWIRFYSHGGKIKKQIFDTDNEL